MDATLAFMVDVQQLSGLSEQQLRELASTLIAQIARKDQDILYRQAKIDQLTHELAVLKRWKFGKSREQLDPAQASLLDEAIDGDIAAIEVELEQLAPAGAKPSTAPRTQPKRMPLPMLITSMPTMTCSSQVVANCTLKAGRNPPSPIFMMRASASVVLARAWALEPLRFGSLCVPGSYVRRTESRECKAAWPRRRMLCRHSKKAR